jgi:hypothetical protein
LTIGIKTVEKNVKKLLNKKFTIEVWKRGSFEFSHALVLHVNEPEQRVRAALGRLARPKTFYLETNRKRQLNSNAPD